MDASVVLIEPALLEELPRIQELYGNLGPRPPAPLERLREVFEATLRYPSYAIYVAKADGWICGTFALLIFEAPGARCAPVGVVEDVVVDEQYRGRGIGREMMSFAMARCRQAGCYKLMLSSNMERTEAHSFYQSLGFRMHGYSLAVELD